MHSPPVQPISSSTSGTGSVMTMWLEVTVSERRSGRNRSSDPPAARIAAPAPGPLPPAVSAITPPSRLGAASRTGVCSWISTPALEQPAPQPGGEARRLDASPPIG